MSTITSTYPNVPESNRVSVFKLTMAFTPITTRTELELENLNLLNSIADAQHVDTASLRKCEISTTINNIQYGTYTAQDERHEACVIFFCFEIVGQQRSDQRIKELDITLSVFGAPSTAEHTTAPPSKGAVLEIRLRDPTRGQTMPSRQHVSSQLKVGGVAGYQFAGVNTGYSTSKQQEVSNWALLESHLRNKRTVNFRLRENSMLKDGVPSPLECAVVLRTDRLSFSIGADFTASIPYLGNILTKKATAKVLMGENLVRRKESTTSNGRSVPDELQDMASDDFLKWMRANIRNEWIAA